MYGCQQNLITDSECLPFLEYSATRNSKFKIQNSKLGYD